ncbi:four helix bundle protein [Candidatus Margulisiibacteriota bacterium]
MRPYEKLKFYQNVCEIRRLVYRITERFRNTHYRLVSQMRDSARSAKQNIREGYAKGTAKQFVQYIRISLGSLDELKGDIDDCREDNLITHREHNNLACLYASACCLSIRYIESIKKLDAEGKWHIPGKNFRK